MALPDYQGLWEQVTSPTDAATVLLAGSAGFVVDAGLNAIGFLSPGAVGVTAAGAALGVKKGWEAQRAARAIRRRAASAPDRAELAIEYLLGKGYAAGVERLKGELELFHEGLIEDGALEQSVDEVLLSYREGLGGK